MTMRRVKLVPDAREQAQDLGLPVGFLQDPARFEMEVQDDGTFVVDNRDFHLLRYHGLVEEAAVDSPAADQPEAEAAADVSRTATRDRGPSGTTSAVVGGTGHQPGDGYSNMDRVQGEIRRDQERGAALRADQGLPGAKANELDQNLRHEGRLPQERGWRGGDQTVFQDRDEAEKVNKSFVQDAEDQAKDQEKATKAAQREAKDKAKGSKTKGRTGADKDLGDGKDTEPQGESFGESEGGSVRDQDPDQPKSGDRLDQRLAQNPDKGAGAEARGKTTGAATKGDKDKD